MKDWSCCWRSYKFWRLVELP